jgi:hypothetical protein
MIFASKNAFNLHTLSRRNDLHSLCYLLLYLIDGDLVFLQKNNEQEADDDDDDSNLENTLSELNEYNSEDEEK